MKLTQEQKRIIQFAYFGMDGVEVVEVVGKGAADEQAEALGQTLKLWEAGE